MVKEFPMINKVFKNGDDADVERRFQKFIRILLLLRQWSRISEASILD